MYHCHKASSELRGGEDALPLSELKDLRALLALVLELIPSSCTPVEQWGVLQSPATSSCRQGECWSCQHMGRAGCPAQAQHGTKLGMCCRCQRVLGSAQEAWHSGGAFPSLCCLFALPVLYVPGQIYSEDAVVLLRCRACASEGRAL